MSVRASLALSFAQKYALFGISLASSMVIARILTPAEIGIFSVAMAVVSVAQVVRELGVSRYLIQEKELTEQRLRTAFGILLATSVLIAGLLFAASGWIADFFDEPGLRDVLIVLCVGFLLIPVGSIVNAQLSRDMRFGALFLLLVPPSALAAAVTIVLAARGFGYMSLAWGALVNFAGVALIGALLNPRIAVLRPSLAEWRRVLSFGGYATAAGLLAQSATRAPDVVLGRLMGFTAAGFFGRAVGIVDMFQQNIMNAVDPVALPAVARAVRSGQPLRDPYLRAVTYMTSVSWPFYGLLALLAFPAVRILFGDQWDPVVPLVQILCVARIVRSITPITSAVLTGLGRIKRLFWIEVIVNSVSIPILVVTAFHSLEAVALSRIAAAVVVVAAHHLSMVADLRLGFAAVARACLPALLLSAITLAGPAVAVAAMGLTPETFWITSLVAGILAVLGWVSGLFLINHPLRAEVQLLFTYVDAFVGRVLRRQIRRVK